MQSFYIARGELLAMQENYRKQHNQWCDNDRELLKEFLAIGVPVTETTAEMINKGLIFSKIQGQSITVEYNPDAHLK